MYFKTYITLIKNKNKNLSKYRQVGSCFKVVIVKNPMVQSEFNFDTQFNIYRVLSSKQL
jgi:hypothetical protein